MNRFGTFVIKPQFSQARGFSEGLAAVRTLPGGGFIYIDTYGNQAFPGEFEYASRFVMGLANVKNWDKFKYESQWIDRKGRVIFDSRIPAGR